MGTVLMTLFIIIFGVLPIIVLGGIGIYLLFSWRKKKSEALKSQSWLATTGEITGLNINTTGSLHGGDEYLAVIRYKYVVSDQVYHSQRYSFGKEPKFLVYTEAGIFLDQYQQGDQISIFYNPEDPAQAVLNKELQVGKGRLVAGILCILPTFCLLCFLSLLLLDWIMKSLA